MSNPFAKLVRCRTVFDDVPRFKIASLRFEEFFCPLACSALGVFDKKKFRHTGTISVRSRADKLKFNFDKFLFAVVAFFGGEELNSPHEKTFRERGPRRDNSRGFRVGTRLGAYTP